MACAVPSGLAAPAQAEEPVPALAPETVPAAVTAAVNALALDARPCELMTRDLREHVAVVELLSHDPVVAEPWEPTDVTRLCNAYVVAGVGFGVGIFPDRGGWVATEIGPARVVETSGDMVRLRSRVVQRFTPARDVLGSERVVDLFVVREEGVWRLASLAGLLQLDLSNGSVPGTLAAFARERRAQTAETRRRLRAHARMVRELASVPRPLSRTSPSCGAGGRGGVSGRADSSSNVRRFDEHSERVRGPRAARADMVAVRLRTWGGRMCWTVRFRGDVADRIDVRFILTQPSGRDDLRAASWSLRLDGGRAAGVLEDHDGVQRMFAVRASVRGRVLRVVVPARRVRGQVRTGERFRWSAIDYMPDPDRPPGGTVEWVDELPQLVERGILHRP
ncbi:hypothetical protein [Conexibacter woesei]|uniref:hypothetical protein n=1 Tax=Conexibacter woesei TaxID=191495 RepID=UPI0005A0C0E9|nr:hypothetical protein [Conexibacter woesei]